MGCQGAGRCGIIGGGCCGLCWAAGLASPSPGTARRDAELCYNQGRWFAQRDGFQSSPNRSCWAVGVRCNGAGARVVGAEAGIPMWAMIAEPGLRCAECRHTIQPGRLCLSELLEEMPPGVSRGDFRNYCIGCPQCWGLGKHACYVRHLDGRRGIIAAASDTRGLPCSQKAGWRFGYWRCR